MSAQEKFNCFVCYSILAWDYCSITHLRLFIDRDGINMLPVNKLLLVEKILAKTEIYIFKEDCPKHGDILIPYKTLFRKSDYFQTFCKSLETPSLRLHNLLLQFNMH